MLIPADIWAFPEMGVPLVIIHFNEIFHYKPSILGYPQFWKPPYVNGHLRNLNWRYRPMIQGYGSGDILTKYGQTYGTDGPPFWDPGIPIEI